MYEVLVGNIGRVYAGSDENTAAAKFDEYVSQSKAGYCRASGESVAMLFGGEIVAEFTGINDIGLMEDDYV